MKKHQRPKREPLKCSLCGSMDRDVTSCESGFLCDGCSERIRQGRDSTTNTVRAMQRAMRDQADTLREGSEFQPFVPHDYGLAATELMHAELFQPARSVLLGAGQELAPQNQPWLRDTMLKPTVVALDASAARVDLLAQAGVEAVALGLDMAETVGAQNSLERALAHQMAAAHKAAMDTLSRSSLEPDPTHRVRLVNSATRLMTTFQTGMLTLRKFRSRSDQTVMVQHVRVEDGGQAVIGDIVQGGHERKL